MNATVTLPIGELDKLRGTIEYQDKLIEEYKKNEKSVLLVVKEKSTRMEYIPMRNIWDSPKYIEKEYYLEQPPLYIGFDEVKEELKKNAESEVIEKIGKLEREKKNFEQSIQNNLTHFEETLSSTKKSYEEKIKELNKSYEDKIESLNKEIRVLKGELIDLGKDEQIKKLTEEIENLKNKNFFQRLFNL